MSRFAARVVWTAAVVGAVSWHPAAAELCAADPVPAATLLFPVVEVYEVGCPSPTDTTRLRLVNHEPAPLIAKVTVWSDWSEVVAETDVFMTGYDVAKVDVGGLWCSSARQPGAKGFVTFRGYATVDVLDGQSNGLDPTDAAYYTTVLDDLNALSGEATVVTGSGSETQLYQAVAIEAAAGPDVFRPGDHTFYGRYVAGAATDRREPLPSTFDAPFRGDSGFVGTRLYVWREAGPGSSSLVKGSFPPWYPLTEEQVVAFDEAEMPEDLTALGPHFREEANWEDVEDLPTTFSSGHLFLALGNPTVQPIYGDSRAQAWVLVAHEATDGTLHVQHATALDSNCDFVQTDTPGDCDSDGDADAADIACLVERIHQ